MKRRVHSVTHTVVCWCYVTVYKRDTVARQQDGLTQPCHSVRTQHSAQGEGRRVSGGDSRACRGTSWSDSSRQANHRPPARHLRRTYDDKYTPFYFLEHDVLTFTRDSRNAIARLSHRTYVCLSVRLSHGWIRQKRCKLGSSNLHHRLPQRL